MGSRCPGAAGCLVGGAAAVQGGGEGGKGPALSPTSLEEVVQGGGEDRVAADQELAGQTGCWSGCSETEAAVGTPLLSGLGESSEAADTGAEATYVPQLLQKSS
ncbi:hypothetical protein A4R35_15540 [Thermogemmatispora tikiterensis]|uniref:Uncharacterized protein n=1 Tax=Thermogemmatispora tikiterensis TaxID=1825093 RepID=A0A328VMC7_9CHLR|nr:hypothetical protein A4R35_15540 [Thermogemmatispora tikiterensis]